MTSLNHSPNYLPGSQSTLHNVGASHGKKNVEQEEPSGSIRFAKEGRIGAVRGASFLGACRRERGGEGDDSNIYKPSQSRGRIRG